MTFTPELLAPAGNMEKFHAALLYGADAVYLGGVTGNLRASSEGFTHDELALALCEANKRNVKIYYCLNSLPYEQHLTDMPKQIEAAAHAGVHGFIIADPGVLRLARRYAPQVEVHLSTQANTTNSEAIAFWADQGVCRVNLARELSCREIHALRKHCPDMQLEVFVHGAMCLAISGQCLLSGWLNKRPANLGRCTQPCRFGYRALQRKDAGLHSVPSAGSACSHSAHCVSEHGSEAAPDLVVDEQNRLGTPVWEVRETEEFSSFWAPDDLCLMPWLPWFFNNGIHALKIEGRMRSAAYVAHAVDAYKTALCHLAAHRRGNAAQPFAPARYVEELLLTSIRPLSSGFFVPETRRYSTSSTEPVRVCSVVARVLEPLDSAKGAWIVDVRANWETDMNVELMLPGMARPILRAHSYRFENHRGEAAHRITCGTRCTLFAEHPGIEPGVFIRQG